MFYYSRDRKGEHPQAHLARYDGILCQSASKFDKIARRNTQFAKLSQNNDLAKAFNYVLKRWPSFTLFLEDGRVCLSNNTAERGLRGIVILESLCIPSSSVCKHWNRVVVSDATRATFSGQRRFNRTRCQVVGANLVWRARYNLHRGQHAGFDQAAYRVACDAQSCSRLG